MICSNCGQEVDSVKSVIVTKQILEGCESCLPKQLQQGESAKFNREWQKKQFRKELTQPNQGREFAKAYPKEARERYGDELFRSLS